MCDYSGMSEDEELEVIMEDRHRLRHLAVLPPNYGEPVEAQIDKMEVERE